MERINLYKTFLNKQKLSVTQERLEIARIAIGFKERFFTAEDIFEASAQKGFIVAKLTVYRNMRLRDMERWSELKVINAFPHVHKRE